MHVCILCFEYFNNGEIVATINIMKLCNVPILLSFMKIYTGIYLAWKDRQKIISKFSLIELFVAIAIIEMSLHMLYRKMEKWILITYVISTTVINTKHSISKN